MRGRVGKVFGGSVEKQKPLVLRHRVARSLTIGGRPVPFAAEGALRSGNRTCELLSTGQRRATVHNGAVILPEQYVLACGSGGAQYNPRRRLRTSEPGSRREESHYSQFGSGHSANRFD